MTGRSRVTGDGSGIQMTWSCRRQCVTMRTPWVGQTDDGIYGVTVARHPHVMFPHTVLSTLPAWHTSRNTYSTLCRKWMRRWLLCTETTHQQHIACHDCLLSIRSLVNNRLWKFKHRLQNNSSRTSLYKTEQFVIARGLRCRALSNRALFRERFQLLL